MQAEEIIAPVMNKQQSIDEVYNKYELMISENSPKKKNKRSILGSSGGGSDNASQTEDGESEELPAIQSMQLKKRRPTLFER